jgi:hypothetical protein
MRAIGFRHHQESLTKNDTPQLRGMLHQVRHLVRVEDVKQAAKKKVSAEASTASAEKTVPKKQTAEPVAETAKEKTPAKLTAKPAAEKAADATTKAAPAEPKAEKEEAD